MKIISERIVADAEAIEILKGRAKEIELVYEQKNALEHLKKFLKLKLEKAEKMIDELEKIEKLRDRQVIEIVNLLPQDRDELRMLLQKEYSSFSSEEIDQILEIVKRGM